MDGAQQGDKPKRGRPKGSKNKIGNGANADMIENSSTGVVGKNYVGATPETETGMVGITPETEQSKVKLTAENMPPIVLTAKQNVQSEMPKPNQQEQINYENYLTDDDYVVEEKTKVKYIPLKSLEKIARIKGWYRIDVDAVKPLTISDLSAVVKCTIEWNNGQISTGLGDAHKANVQGNYVAYLTQVAETRAYARALRKGLGITVCAMEEVAPEKTAEDMDSLKSISDAQKTLIDKLLKENNMDFLKILEDHEIENVYSLDDLNMIQAKKLIKWLQGKVARKNAQL